MNEQERREWETAKKKYTVGDLWIEAVKVIPRPNFSLVITFNTGETKIYDFTPNFQYEAFQPLKDINLFLKARAAGDAIIWSDEIDIAIERVYEESIDADETIAG
jgi:hypothetical protein